MTDTDLTETIPTKTDLTGRAVIITGGASGPGPEVTQSWLEAGASVLVVDDVQAALDGLQSGLPLHLTSRLMTVVADVTTEEGTARMMFVADATFDRPADTLVHLVGGYATGPLDAPDATQTWERMMALNLTSALQCYRAVLPGMKALGGGWIVGMGPQFDARPGADLAAYAASMAGLTALTLSLSDEMRHLGIHVGLMPPPATGTPEGITEATLSFCSV